MFSKDKIKMIIINKLIKDITTRWIEIFFNKFDFFNKI
jgi:hypothetical protein